MVLFGDTIEGQHSRIVSVARPGRPAKRTCWIETYDNLCLPPENPLLLLWDEARNPII